MKRKRTVELIGSVIGNIIAIVIVNLWFLWRPWTFGVVQESFGRVLWAINLSLAVQIGGNMLLIFFRPAPLYALVRAAMAGVELISISVFYAVFPLDFSHLLGAWLNSLVRIAVIIGMVATAVTCIVYLVRLITFTPYRSD